MFFSCPQVSDLTCHCEALPSNQQCGRTHRRTQGPATLGTGPGSRRHTLVAARVAFLYMKAPSLRALSGGHVGQNNLARPIVIRWLRMKGNLPISEY